LDEDRGVNAVPEKRNSFAVSIRRGRLLQLASDRLGQQSLADAMGITPRALRMKLGMDRGITNADLVCARELLLADMQSAMALAADLATATEPQPLAAIVADMVPA
jgi:hypothetical protein